MQRLIKSLSLAALFIATASQAHAGLLLEPYLDYAASGGYSYSTVSHNMTGVSYGGRVGYESPFGWMAGFDGMTGSWNDNANPSDSITPTDLGVFVGYNFPIMIRVYAGYNFSSQLKFTQGSNSDTYKGSDFKLGVGFKVVPLLSINVEYISGTYTKDNSGSLQNNVTDHMLQIGLSIPFDLM